MLMIGNSDIGGAFVRIAFNIDGKRLMPRTHLTADQVQSWSNWRALERSGRIVVYPPVPDAAPGVNARHVVHNGGGRYDVIVGQKLNETPLTREQVEELAANAGN